MNIQEIFERLWNDYREKTPSADRIRELFHSRGEMVKNDHIAFRTFNDPKVKLEILAHPFLDEGYIEKGNYIFRQKHLEARHYELPGDPDAPRIFISQLVLEAFSPTLRDTVTKLIDGIPRKELEPGHLLFAGSVFGRPSYTTYMDLRDESEYAAWLYIFGYRANHFTVSVNHLKEFPDLEHVNTFLKANGFELNSSGGEIKGTREQLLRQSSILADKVDVDFTDGLHAVPSCYYEFAERYKDAEGRLFGGFIADSADKIFETTNFRK